MVFRVLKRTALVRLLFGIHIFAKNKKIDLDYAICVYDFSIMPYMLWVLKRIVSMRRLPILWILYVFIIESAFN